MNMERRKIILAILTATIIMTTIFAPTLLIKPVIAIDPTDWYMNVAGVLNSDSYSLYPYKNDKSLKIGFSQFGEMIDSINNIGLEYRDRDAFAPAVGSSVPSQIAKKKWMSGWLINITYQGTSGRRNIWAMAQHADLIDYGKNWIRIDRTYNYSDALTESEEDPRDVGKFIGTGVGPVNGGRKTNGTAVTEAIRVLYNGPRMFIARTVTHIYDWDLGWSEDESLVDVIFTFIFNKDKKEVIVIKDIKEDTTKFVFGQVKVPINGTRQATINATVNGAIVQFSNRGEWDIGPANTYDSYVHFYVQNQSEGQSTVYDGDYHLNPTLSPGSWLGISDHGDEPDASGSYDVAQIVASDRTYVGWAAFWPSLSNWYVDAGYQDKWWKSLSQNESATDTSIEPFMSPYLIGEWDFVLSKTRANVTGTEGEGYENYWRIFDRQFRGVTVYGLTDNWNGDDLKRSGGSNVIDREVRYQLEEILNPWDLYDAVEKDTERWVDFHTVTAEEKTAADAGTNLTIALSNSPVKYAEQWDSYCNFTERVEWGNVFKHPARSVWAYPNTTLSANEPYELTVATLTGIGTITIRAASVPAIGTIIKITYSTYTNDTIYPSTTYTSSDNAGVNNGTGNTLTAWYGETSKLNATKTDTDSEMYTDKFGANYTFGVDFSHYWSLRNNTSTKNGTLQVSGSLTFNASEIKVFKEDTAFVKWLQLGDDWSSSGWQKYALNTTDNALINMTQLSLNWTVTPPTHTDLHIDFANITLGYNVNVTYWRNDTMWTWNATWSYNVSSVITEHIPGRYEWAVVGNHSRTIDSIGSAMVAAAFKNKQIEMGNGGLDMKDMWGTNVPVLLSNGTYTTWRPAGPAWCNIYDSIGRLHLVDDWCTRYPVTTSNIITVAGPSANLMSEYFNEFSQGLQVYGGMPNMLLSDVIFATTCWNDTVISGFLGQRYYSNGQLYQGSTGTGVAVITTYKDLNGTVGFMIHGWSGDDTYYACKWFHEYGIYYLQTENRGVTTLIIRIDYNNYSERTTNPMPPNYNYDSHNPYVEIVERLGTISEKTPHDP
jgi:hypothetical protein